jgi:preprotein translocase subunit YajC
MPGSEKAEIYFIAAMMILILIISFAAVFFFFRQYKKEQKEKVRGIEADTNKLEEPTAVDQSKF